MKNKFKNLDQSLKEICKDDNTGLDYDANYQYVYSEIEEYADITDNYFAFCWFMDELN